MLDKEANFSLILCNNNEPFLDWIVTSNEKWILQDNRQWLAQWMDQESTPKHVWKSNLHQENVMVTIQWSAASLIHCSILNSSKTITSEKYAQQINEMHQKLQCLQPELVNRKGPILLHYCAQLHVTQATLQKLNKLVYDVSVFDYIHLTSWQLTTTSSSILTTFCRENASTAIKRPKILSKSSGIPEHRFLHYENKQTYLTKMFWL